MFYKGIVEDNNDNLQLGRVKVRVIGKHCPKSKKSDPYEFLPTSDLPYASPIFPAGASSISGVSVFSVPSVNSVVVCGYFDEDEQELFYIGTLGLIGSNKIEGFGVESNPNPTKNYPLSDLVKGTNTITSSSTSNSLFSIPPSDYSATYPNNNVIETKSGHVIELDDTNGSERIRIYHKSGTYNETNADGTNVESVKGDKYLEAPNINIHCDTNCNIYIGSNNNINVGSDNTVIIGNDCDIQVGNNSTLTVGVNSSVIAGGNISLTAAGGIGVTAAGTYGGSSGGIDITVKGDANISTESTCNLSSLGECNISASTINLNP